MRAAVSRLLVLLLLAAVAEAQLSALTLSASGAKLGSVTAAGGAATLLAPPGVWLSAGCGGAGSGAGAQAAYLVLSSNDTSSSAPAVLLSARLPPDGSAAAPLSSAGPAPPLAHAGAASLTDGTPALVGLGPVAGALRLSAVYASPAGSPLRSAVLGSSTAVCAGPAGPSAVDARRGVLHSLCGVPGAAAAGQQLITLNISTGETVRTAALGAPGVYFTALSVDAGSGQVSALALATATTAGAPMRLQAGTLEPGAGWAATWTATDAPAWVHAGAAAAAGASAALAWAQSASLLASAGASLVFADGTTPQALSGSSVALVALPVATPPAPPPLPPPEVATVSVSLALTGLTSFDADTARAVAESAAAALGGGVSADDITVTLSDFQVKSSMALDGITLADWTPSVATAFASGVAEDLGVDAARVSLGTPSAVTRRKLIRRRLLDASLPKAPQQHRRLLAASLLVPFTVSGFGADSGSAAAAAAAVTSAAAAPNGHLTSRLLSAGIAATLTVATPPALTALVVVTINVRSGSAAAMTSAFTAASTNGGLAAALAASGVDASVSVAAPPAPATPTAPPAVVAQPPPAGGDGKPPLRLALGLGLGLGLGFMLVACALAAAYAVGAHAVGWRRGAPATKSDEEEQRAPAAMQQRPIPGLSRSSSPLESSDDEEYSKRWRARRGASFSDDGALAVGQDSSDAPWRIRDAEDEARWRTFQYGKIITMLMNDDWEEEEEEKKKEKDRMAARGKIITMIMDELDEFDRGKS